MYVVWARRLVLTFWTVLEYPPPQLHPDIQDLRWEGGRIRGWNPRADREFSPGLLRRITNAGLLFGDVDVRYLYIFGVARAL